jgi:hypothetical protein
MHLHPCYCRNVCKFVHPAHMHSLYFKFIKVVTQKQKELEAWIASQQHYNQCITPATTVPANQLCLLVIFQDQPQV